MSSSAKSSGVGVPAMPTGCPLDLSRALRWVDGDRELLVELVDVLIADYPRRMDALRSAIQAGDSAIARDTAHSLKGAVAALAADAARECAQHLEDLCGAGRLADIEIPLAQLERETDRLMGFLRTKDWQAQL